MEMKQFPSIKTIALDLDGTIYQDVRFHQSYLRHLVKDTDKADWAEALIDFAEQVLSGRRLCMNTFYRERTIQAASPPQYFAALEASAVLDATYESAMQGGDLLYLGDAWALVTLLGKTLGLLDNNRGDTVYYATRMDMEAAAPAGSAALKAALAAAGKKFELVLLSNSYESVAVRYLKILGYHDLFSAVCYGANKPAGFLRALETICPGALSRPETLMSIGDHAFNDLMPLQEIGGTAVWVNPYQDVHEPTYDAKLNSVEDLAQFLQTMCALKQ